VGAAGAFLVLILVVCLAPLVLHLAYLPNGRVLAFNDWGDCSYGALHLRLSYPADAGVALSRHAADP
jgi:hypothetical protein